MEGIHIFFSNLEERLFPIDLTLNGTSSEVKGFVDTDSWRIKIPEGLPFGTAIYDNLYVSLKF